MEIGAAQARDVLRGDLQVQQLQLRHVRSGGPGPSLAQASSLGAAHQLRQLHDYVRPVEHALLHAAVVHRAEAGGALRRAPSDGYTGKEVFLDLR